MRPIGAYSSVLVLALASTAACEEPHTTASNEGHEPWLWQVLDVREATAEDVPFEESSRYLWPSAKSNDVLGPDSLRVFVRTNDERRPQLYLEDLKSGTTDLLFPGYAFGPRWSPDGGYIACTEWKSMSRYSDLTIIELTSRQVLAGPVASTTSTKTWSPDGKMLLVSGILYGVGHSVLYSLSVPELVPLTLDSTEVVAEHDHSWSPDSRWVAYTRPTRVEPVGGDTIAADLWIASPTTGERWCVVKSPDWVESQPLWITNRSILIERRYWNGTHFGTTQRKVLDLDLSQQPGASP